MLLIIKNQYVLYMCKILVFNSRITYQISRHKYKYLASESTDFCFFCCDKWSMGSHL